MRKINKNIELPLEELLEVITSKVVRTLYQQGFLDLTTIRNEKIRCEFRKLRAGKMRVEEAILILSEQDYHSKNGNSYRIGQESIRKIVYKEI